MTEIRILLSFWSFMKLMIVGALCSGIVLMPLEAVIAAQQQGGTFLGNLRFPSGTLLTGAISAVAGYPLYWFLATRSSWAARLRGKSLGE